MNPNPLKYSQRKQHTTKIKMKIKKKEAGKIAKNAGKKKDTRYLQKGGMYPIPSHSIPRPHNTNHTLPKTIDLAKRCKRPAYKKSRIPIIPFPFACPLLP